MTVTDRANAGALRAIGTKFAAVAAAFAAVVAGATALLAVSAGPAEALPSYARQTGQPCAACHTAFPELTPFGRRFKIGGYTLQGGDWQGPPIAAMYMARLHPHEFAVRGRPARPRACTPTTISSPSRSRASSPAASSATSARSSRSPAIRSAARSGSTRPTSATPTRSSCSARTRSGASTPTTRRPSKTPGTRRRPGAGHRSPRPSRRPSGRRRPTSRTDTARSSAAPAPTSSGTTCCTPLHRLQRASGARRCRRLNVGNSTTDAVTNVAPYWRVALEPHWGDHYLMVGTFGMYGQVVPGRQYGFGTDNYLDVGFDSQYQYDGDQYSVTVKLTDIMEWQKLNATYALSNSSNLSNTLNSFKANASFVWDHTYSIGLGYFNVTGSSDCNLYGSGYNAFCTPVSIGTCRQQLHQQPERQRHDPRPRLPTLQPRRSVPLLDNRTSASASSSPSISMSMAARTISTGRISAARTTRRATIRCSPMRGWRSEP